MTPVQHWRIDEIAKQISKIYTSGNDIPWMCKIREEHTEKEAMDAVAFLLEIGKTNDGRLAHHVISTWHEDGESGVIAWVERWRRMEKTPTKQLIKTNKMKLI